MEKHWQFIHLSRAWYGPSCLGIRKDREIVDEVNFGIYPPGGGTTGEMSVVFSWLGGKITPCLHCFDDSWKSLASFGAPFLDALAAVDGQDISPAAFCEILLTLGFKDATPEKEIK